MSHFLMRCDDCGAEGTVTKSDGVCHLCRRKTEIFTCVCGCGASGCLDCLGSLPGKHNHHWRIAASLEAASLEAASLEAEA